MTSLPAEKQHRPTTSPLAPDHFFWLENSADELDGKDSAAFFSGKTYTARRDEAGPGGRQDRLMTVPCDPGDEVLGGGGGVSPDIFFPTDDGSVTFSRPGSLGSWNVSVQDNGSSSNVFVEAICADFPPLRP